MNRIEGEKALKRYLKRSVGFSLSILIGFLITGQVSLGADVNKELQIQDLLKSIQIEKEELNEKLLELDKELAIVKNSKDSSIQFFLSTLFESRKSKKSDDNGFNDVIDDWEDSIKDKPNIDIPDIRDDVKPVVPDIPNPLPNEDSIVIEPDFGLEPVGNIAIGNVPNDIDITIDKIDLPVSEIKDGNFNIPTNDNISTPEFEDIVINDINIPDINSDITTKIQTPIINNINDLPTFNAPEIEVAIKDITAPESFSIKDVKIDTNGLNQGAGTAKVEDASENDSVVQNYSSYKSVGDSTNIRFSQNDISYGIGNKDGKIDFGNNYQTWGEDVLYLDGKLNGKIDPYEWWKPPYRDQQGEALRKYYMHAPIAAFITDLHGNDTTVEGVYNLNYTAMTPQGEGHYIDSFIRIFLSINPAGLATGDYDSNTKSEQIKITRVQGTDGKEGEINLTTSEANGIAFNGNLIAMEHQLWDKFYSGNSTNFANSYSVLLNNSTINLGNSEENGEDKPYSKNMIGIMVDLEESNGNTYAKNQNHKTINNGAININGTNSIGFSFEEYRNKDNLEKGDFILRDDAYLGKINVNGTQNYGFRMANIFNDGTREDFNTYFDKVKVIGNTTNGEIKIDYTGSGQNKETVTDYTSKIVVGGKQNAGMVVGKSLSNSASDYINEFGNDKVNPIANFENISIEVNGEQTIGFVRDKNYSDNNKNDMVITDKNINDIKFGNDAKNSVLFRSEMYGITNSNKLDVSGAGSNHQTNDFYNIAMQATRQSWDKDGDGNNDINSSGSITNSSEISGKVNNMIGMMASGKTDFGINSWQNNETESKAKASNKGNISLTGKNNIGMAILDDNEGNNSGNITIKGNDGIGVYNTGTFTNSELLM
jgi:hypothetical protein